MTGRRWPVSWVSANVPKAMHELQFDLHFADYPGSVAAAGGVPVELTRDADVVEVLARIDGLILSGGADVEPQHYGHDRHEQLGLTEPERDEWEIALLREARHLEMPVLAICRGAQLANVFFGGTLTQHVELDEGSGHPQWDVDGRTATHDVQVVDGTVLSTLYPKTLGVNSLHHQTLAVLGNDLVVSAMAPDGVIEAVELPEHDFLGVQWHPELLEKPDPTFRWLVERSAGYLARKS